MTHGFQTCHFVSSQLRKTYGDVYSIFLGREPAVVINGVKAMKEAMVTKAADFAGRPQGLFVNELVDGKGRIYIMLYAV